MLPFAVMTMTSDPSAPSTLQAFRSVPRTGVVYVTKEASARGYRTGHPEWSNLGQGQPETGQLPGAPPRVGAIDIDPADHYYAPVAGVRELREAVASLYNQLYRKGMKSQYTAENVAISGGGRAALTRACLARPGEPRPLPAGLHRLRGAAGHLPAGLADPHPAAPRAGLQLRRRRPAARGAGPGLAVILFSNPCNPMGKLISGGELATGWPWGAISTARC